ARPGVDVLDPFLRELVRAPHVILEVGVATVDDHVSNREMLAQGEDHVFRGLARRHHEPDGARRIQSLDEVVEALSADGSLAGQFLDGLGIAIPDHALVASREKPPHHVATHPSKADHADLHRLLLSLDGESIGCLTRPAPGLQDPPGMRAREMKNVWTGAAAALLCLLSSGPADAADVALGGKAGTLGLGVELTVGLGRQWNTRLSANGFNYSDRREASDIEY